MTLSRRVKSAAVDWTGASAQNAAEKAKMRAAIKALSERAYAEALGSGSKRRAAILRHVAEQAVEHDNLAPFAFLLRMRHMPVTIREFILSPESIGERQPVWPAVLKDLEEICPDVWTGAPPIHEANLGGAEGIGKSVIIQLVLLYTLYQLLCLEQPQTLYGLGPATWIQLPLMSETANRARDLLYVPARQIFEQVPWFRANARWNKEKTQALELEGNLKLYAGPPDVSTFIGGATPAAGLDEINRWAVVTASARASGGSGPGAPNTFDQAEVVGSVLSRRRAGRFTTQGFSIGALLFSSQIQYADDYLERRIAATKGNPRVLTFKHATYEVQPQEKFCGDKFRVLVGTDRWPTRILEEGEEGPAEGDVRLVPVEFKSFFEADPEGACRSYIGVAVGAMAPFIARRDKLAAAFERGQHEGLNAAPWVAKPVVSLERDGLPVVLEANLPPPEVRQRPHFAHVDLSRTTDRTGVAFTRIDGWTSVATSPGVPPANLPVMSVPLAVAIQPSKVVPVDHVALCAWIVRFGTELGVNIRGISFDGYQSDMMQQVLRRAGFRCYEVSVDRTMDAYTGLRAAIYEGRMALPGIPLLNSEMTLLETRTLKTVTKVDHPKKGSKDIADAIAGSAHAAANSPEGRRGSHLTDGEGHRVRRSGSERPSRPRPEGRARPGSAVGQHQDAPGRQNLTMLRDGRYFSLDAED